MLGYMSLAVYYKTIFALIHHHKYSLYDVENMIPFERDIYIDMLVAFLEKQKES